MSTLATALLNYPKGLRLLGIDVDPLDLVAPIHVLVTTTSSRSRCPRCGRYSDRVHSRYNRTLRDLPCCGRGIVAQMNVRRFRCRSPRCTVKVFCERLGELAEPHARHTRRMTISLARIGMAGGGRAGSRLADDLGLHASPMGLLRLVRSSGCHLVSAPSILGVDDFALRRGHTYGTILYDLQNHIVVDLLADRSPESLGAWLLAHPGVEIVSRDRAEAYARGVHDGAPGAVQVADRWHLLSNLGDALERFVNQHQAALQQACSEEASDDGQPDRCPQTSQAIRASKAQEQVRHHRAARLARYRQINRLNADGHTTKAIAAHMGMGQSTVRKFLRAPAFPERAARAAVAGKLGPYHALIQERWDAGLQDIKQLLNELTSLGYKGSRSRLYAYAQILRRTGKQLCPLKTGQGKFSVRQVVSAILTPGRTPVQQEMLDRLSAKNALFATARELAERFCALMRTRPHQDARVPLERWRTDAEASAIASFISFARGLRSDWEAVVAGLSLEWSNGPVEGAINRLKTIKRQMYGRANFDLLRTRVLSAN